MKGYKRLRKWIVFPAALFLLMIVGAVFRVTEVTVEGNTFYTEEEVEQMLCNDLLDKNTITFFLQEYFGVKEQIPFIREYAAEFEGVGKVHIKLYEKAIVAGIQYMNNYIYFDKEGIVLESSDVKKEDIPLFDVTGLTNFTIFEKIQLDDESSLGRVLEISNLIVHYSIKTERVLFNSRNEAILYSGNLKIYLGKQENYDDVFAELQNIIPTALEQNMSGEIDLSNFNPGSNIILKRNQ